MIRMESLITYHINFFWMHIHKTHSSSILSFSPSTSSNSSSFIFHCSTAKAKSPSDPEFLLIIICCTFWSFIFWTSKGSDPFRWFYHSSLYLSIIWLCGALWAPPWRTLLFWAPRLKGTLFCNKVSTEAVCSWAGNPGIDCCLGLIPIGLLLLLPVPFTEPGLSLEPTI